MASLTAESHDAPAAFSNSKDSKTLCTYESLADALGLGFVNAKEVKRASAAATRCSLKSAASPTNMNALENDLSSCWVFSIVPSFAFCNSPGMEGPGVGGAEG